MHQVDFGHQQQVGNLFPTSRCQRTFHLEVVLLSDAKSQIELYVSSLHVCPKSHYFYADVIKDVDLIIQLKENLNMEEPIAKKLIILLSASLLIPEFFNAILQFSSNPFMVSKRKRLCLVLLSPFTPAVCIYMKGRFAMKKLICLPDADWKTGR
jgi:hypothetical protein